MLPEGIAYPRQEIAWLLRSADALTLAAEHVEEVVAFIALQFRSLGPARARLQPSARRRGELITIDVLQKVRRERIGWRLHEALEQEFCRQGGENIELHVAVDNRAAIAFYRRLNYQCVGRVSRYYLDSIDAWRMEKNFRSAGAMEPQI